MSIYDELQVVAREILQEFGQGAISYVAVTPGTGPVDDPGAATESEYVLPYAVARGVLAKYVQSGLAIASDLQVTAGVHPDIVPNLRGFVKIDNIRYKIVQIIPSPAAGTTVANIFIVRK